MKDYYKILGVSPGDSKEDIRKAYIRLARKYHPDTTEFGKNEAEDLMKEINEAWNVLSNEERRKEYDESRKPKKTVVKKKKKEPEKKDWHDVRDDLVADGLSYKEANDIVMERIMAEARRTGRYGEALEFADETGNWRYMVQLRAKALRWLIVKLAVIDKRFIARLCSFIVLFIMIKLMAVTVPTAVKSALPTKPPVLIKQESVNLEKHVQVVQQCLLQLSQGKTPTQYTVPGFITERAFTDVDGVLENLVELVPEIKNPRAVSRRSCRMEITLEGIKDAGGIYKGVLIKGIVETTERNGMVLVERIVLTQGSIL